jgi:hypothetical protein
MLAMYLKIFRVVWFVTLVAFMVALLYGYAGLQEMVTLPYYGGESSKLVTFSKELFFYFFLGLAAFVNALVFIVRGLLKKKEFEPFKTWFHGLVITLHIFFIIAISFVGVANSGERFDYSRIGIIIYSSVILIIIWALAWPLYLAFARIFNKQAV